MTTYIIYSDPNDGYIQARNATYSAARLASGTDKTAVTNSQYLHVGQNIGSGLYWVYQSFLSFDTSVIADAEEIVDVNLSAYTGWTKSSHSVNWTQGFYPTTWTAPLTTAQWKNPSTLGSPVAKFDWSRSTSSPFLRRATGADALINSISKTAATKFVSVSSLTVIGNASVPTEIYMEGADTTNKPYLVVYTVALDTLNMVERAALTLSDGTTVSLRSNGAASPTITLGYQPINGSWTSISTLNAAFNKTIDGTNSLALVADHLNNFYILGAGASAGQLVGQAFIRTSPTVWTAKNPLTQSIPAGNEQMIRSISAEWMGGTSTKDSYFIRAMVARGASGAALINYTHVPGAGWTQDVSINPETLKAGSGALLFGAANRYFSPAASATGVPVFVDTCKLSANYCAVYIQRGTFGSQRIGSLSVFRNENATGISADFNLDYADTRASKLIAIDAQKFAHVYDNAGTKLVIAFYNNTAKLLGSASIPAESFQGGVIGRQWTAFYDPAAGLVRVYYINATAGTRAIDRVDVSPVTFADTLTVNETTTLGASGSTNIALRVSDNADERRVAIDAANSAAGVLSTQTYFSTVGNFVPSAPAVGTRNNFDATLPAVFSWTFADNNVKDVQTKYQIEISRVSDSVVVFDTGAVTSTASSYTLPANTLTNGINYRWRIRTYDTIGAAGTYSAYNTFSTAATGTTTITAPAIDNALGIDTSSYTVTWTYSGVQAQRQVKLIRVADGVTVFDSTMEANTVNFYTLNDLVSGTEYRIEVNLINSSSLAVPTATRKITVNYSEPMEPTATLTVQNSYVEIVVSNPVPSGSRPEVVYNDIYRRENKPLSLDTDFKRIAIINNNGSYRDYAVKSNKVYDYKIIGRSN